MAEFLWVQFPASGNCLACMSATNERGFVDFIGETVARNPEGEVSGVIDVYICATCLEQAARLVGCASNQETMDLAHTIIEKDTEIEKLKDEIASWQQRFLGLANLDVEDFEKLAKLERASKMEIVTDPAPVEG